MSRTSRSTLVLKRIFDLAVALPGLLVCLPLFGVIAVVSGLESQGPVFFRQVRVGKDGRRFWIVKLRTMRVGALSTGDTGKVTEDRPVEANDPAITRVGRFLRRFGLDELPQLWNVLKGEMSLVGPRPTIPEQVEAYTEWERKRLRVRPGITGAAQVTGRSELDWAERIKLDIDYVERLSLARDLWILWKTLIILIRGS